MPIRVGGETALSLLGRRRMSGRQPLPCRTISSGQRLDEHYKRPQARNEDRDERESRRQAYSDPNPISAGWLGSNLRTSVKRIASLKDLVAHRSP
jgi:hypothetical protein